MTASPGTTRPIHLALIPGLADWEVGHLTAHLASLRGEPDEARYHLVTVSPGAAPVTTMGGLTVQPDLDLADLTPERSAMLVLPGAATWPSPEGQAFVRAAAAFLDAGTPVAAVCGATHALAVAGLLDTRRHTSNDPGYLASSGYAGGHLYDPAPAVVDGDLVTASGVAPVQFARAVLERLDAHPAALLDPWERLHTTQDPAAFFELVSA